MKQDLHLVAAFLRVLFQALNGFVDLSADLGTAVANIPFHGGLGSNYVSLFACVEHAYVDGGIRLLGVEGVEGIDPMHRLGNGGKEGLFQHIACVTRFSDDLCGKEGGAFALYGDRAV